MVSFKDFAQNIWKDFRGVPREEEKKRKGVISAGPSRETWGVSETEKKRVDQEILEYYGYHDPLVFVGLNILWPQACIGNGYKVSETDSEEGKLCDKIIKLQSFEPSLMTCISHILIYGGGFQEVIWKNDWPEPIDKTKMKTSLRAPTEKEPVKNEVTGFDFFHPRTVNPEWDEKGYVTSFKQKIKTGGDPIVFSPNQVAYYKFWQIGDSIKGIGMVEPLIGQLYLKKQLEEHMSVQVDKWANPLLHLTKKGASDQDLIDMTKKFKNIHQQKFFASDETYEAKLIGAEKKALDIRYILNDVLNQVCAGLRIPRPILLAAGREVNRATLEYLIRYNEKEIKLMQNRLSRQIEIQVFQRAIEAAGLSGKIPDFEWNPISTEDEREKAETNHLVISYVGNAVAQRMLTTEEGRKQILELLNIKGEDNPDDNSTDEIGDA